MAEHGSSVSASHGFDAHLSTYKGFVKGGVALFLASAYAIVALVAFGFAPSLGLLIGFGGFIIGVIAVLIDLKVGGRWYLSGAWLVIYCLVTAVAVS